VRPGCWWKVSGVDIWDVGNVIGISGYSCVPFTDGTDTSVFKVGLLVRDVRFVTTALVANRPMVTMESAVDSSVGGGDSGGDTTGGGVSRRRRRRRRWHTTSARSRCQSKSLYPVRWQSGVISGGRNCAGDPRQRWLALIRAAGG